MTNFFAIPLSNGATPRANHSAVIIGSDMYVYGGMDTSSYMSDLWIYSVTNKTWQQLFPSGSCPPSLSGHTACVVNSDMFIFGGRIAENSIESSTDLWRYNSLSNSWIFISDPAVNGLGTSSTSCYNSLNNSWALIPDTEVERRRTQHSAVVIGSKILIFGGFHSNGYPFDTLLCYNVETNSWSKLNGRPAKRYGHSAVVIGSDMFIFGGTIPSEGDNFLYSDLWKYTSSNDSWQQLTGCAKGYHGHTAVAIGTDMLVFGGIYDELNGYSCSVFWKYDSVSDVWTQLFLPDSPIERAGHSAIVIEQKMLIFGGISGYSSFLNDLWEIYPLLPPTITISDLQFPIVAGSIFNVSFSVSEQNGTSDYLQTTLTFGDSNSTISVPNNSAAQTVSLQAPATGGNYCLTIAAYDLLFPDLSDVETVSIPVLQLISSDWLSTNTISIGDSYTIFWSDQILPATSNLVISINRPEGLSGNYGSSGQLQSIAPLIASDYTITVIRTVGSYVTSDTLILHVKMLAVNAGSNCVIPYGQSVRLSTSTTDSPTSYSWSPSSTLVGANTATPTAPPLSTTTYTVIAYASDIKKYASDSGHRNGHSAHHQCYDSVGSKQIRSDGE